MDEDEATGSFFSWEIAVWNERLNGNVSCIRKGWENWRGCGPKDFLCCVFFKGVGRGTNLTGLHDLRGAAFYPGYKWYSRHFVEDDTTNPKGSNTSGAFCISYHFIWMDLRLPTEMFWLLAAWGFQKSHVKSFRGGRGWWDIPIKIPLKGGKHFFQWNESLSLRDTLWDTSKTDWTSQPEQKEPKVFGKMSFHQVIVWRKRGKTMAWLGGHWICPPHTGPM